LPEPRGSGRDETEHERLDLNREELLGELRVALPGVQVLWYLVPLRHLSDINTDSNTEDDP